MNQDMIIFTAIKVKYDEETDSLEVFPKSKYKVCEFKNNIRQISEVLSDKTGKPLKSRCNVITFEGDVFLVLEDFKRMCDLVFSNSTNIIEIENQGRAIVEGFSKKKESNQSSKKKLK